MDDTARIAPGRYVVIDGESPAPWQWGTVVDAAVPLFAPDPAETYDPGQPSRFRRAETWTVRVHGAAEGEVYPFEAGRLTVATDAEIKALGESGQLR